MEGSNIIVGSKEGTQQLLLGQMIVQVLEEAGYDVSDQTGFGDTLAVREALEKGELDLYWELTGTALTVIHELPTNALPMDPNRLYQMAKSQDQILELVWLERLEINDSYTLLVREESWNEGITNIEQLAELVKSKDKALKLCAESEFLARPDGLPGLEEHYGFTLGDENIEILEQSQIYQELQEGNCDVGQGLNTDGWIEAWGFKRLADTRSFFPFYNPAPVVRQATLQAQPELASVLAELLATLRAGLDEGSMQELNACIELGVDGIPESGDEIPVEEVARSFLQHESLNCLPTKIVVSSYDLAPEVVWVGKMYAQLLSEAGYDVIDKTALGGPKIIRQAILEGEIDLYLDLVSIALMLYHQIPPAAFPANSERAFRLIKSLDQPLGLVWLERAEKVDVTSMFVVRNESYEEGIRTIKDLADFMKANDSPLKICSNVSVTQRPDGIPGVEAFYGFKFKPENLVITQNLEDESYRNLRDGICDVSHGLTSDNLEPWGFKQLEDTEKFFPPFTPAPVIRQAILEEYPEVEQVIRGVSDYLSDETINQLNHLLELGRDGIPDSGDEESLETIARIALCDAKLSQDCSNIPRMIKRPEEAASEETPEETAEESPPEETGPICQELVINGSFEGDEGWTIPATVRSAEYSGDLLHSGTRALRLGDINQASNLFTHSAVRQEISIPQEAITATLAYWYYPLSNDRDGNDTQGALIYNSDTSLVLRKLQGGTSNERAWILQTSDLSSLIGEPINLYFYTENDGHNGSSAMYLDDVSIQACYERQ